MQLTADEREPAVIAAARQGDANAFAQLVDRYQKPVYNLAYRMLGDHAEAEDAAQETFVRAYTRLARFNLKQPFAPWLLSIATHYCLDRLRRAKFAGPSLDDEPLQNTLASEQPEPSAITLAREESEEAQRLLGTLPPPYRVVVVLKYWNDMSLEEIAKVIGDSAGNVKVKLYRARQLMARAAQPRRAGLTPAHAHGANGYAS